MRLMTDLMWGFDDSDGWTIEVCDVCGNGPITGEELETGICECCNTGHAPSDWSRENCWRCGAVLVFEDEEDDDWEE